MEEVFTEAPRKEKEVNENNTPQNGKIRTKLHTPEHKLPRFSLV